MVTVFTYHVKAFAPDPRGGDNYFTYDSTVERDSALNSGREYDALAKGLSEHVYSATGVLVGPGSFVIQHVELLGSREEQKFPAPITDVPEQ